jgi:CDP-diacylglycerol--serine O-phosphatidyltransferase
MKEIEAMKLVGKTESRPHKLRLHERRLKAVAVLPTMATLGNLVCGLGAIYMCMLSYGAAGADLATKTLNSTRMESWFPTYAAIGCYLIFLASVFDGLDGRLARLARKTSEFGAQLDSLADIVSFGVAPALLAMTVARPTLPIAALSEAARVWWRIEWVLLAAYVCCAGLRLARFNVENEEDESAHQKFRGLPSPGAAAALISVVLVHEEIIRVTPLNFASGWVGAALPFLACALGLLMVSRLKYFHLVNSLLRGRRPFWQIVLMGFSLLIGGVIFPQPTIAALALAYAASGPLMRIFRRDSQRPAITPAAVSPSPVTRQDIG